MNAHANLVRKRLTKLFAVLVTLSVFLSLTAAQVISSMFVRYASAVLFALLSSFVFYIFMKKNDWSIDGSKQNQNTTFLDDLTRQVRTDEIFQAVANNFTSSIMVLCPKQGDFSIAYVNRAFSALTGYSREEVIGKMCSILHGPDTDQTTVKACIEAIREGKSMNVEMLNYRKDGTPFWNEIKFSPLHDNEGQVIYYVVFIDDITERKTYEKLLRESEQRYKSLFDNNPEIVCSFDSAGKLIGANPAIEKVTGYSVKDLLGLSYGELAINDLTGSLEKRVQSVFEGEPQTGEISVIHKDGHRLDLELLIVPICIDQQAGGFYVIAKDLTEYRQAQEMLRKTEKLNVVGELAAGIAHEIRNPLTSLKGFVQLLQPNLTSKKEYTEVMLSELDRIEQIVSELLFLARPKTEQFQTGNLKSLLDHVCTLLNTKAIMSNTEIVLDYRAKVSTLYCQENQLKQVFINLVKNSIEAMTSGGVIVIEVDHVDCDHILVRINDEGEGIPEEHLERLGEPFYTTKEQGTGLGLMISSNIIKDHGGTITFKNNEHIGATVEVKLPITRKVDRLKNTESAYTG